MSSSACIKQPDLITAHMGLRGVAAFSVFMGHLGTEQMITFGFGGNLVRPFLWQENAVNLFFILSGFILNWVYFRDGASKIDWKDYLKARCARILPLYYLTLVPYLPPILIAFKCQGLLYNHGKTLALLIANLLLLTGFVGEAHWDWTMNQPAWSISIEFFSYLLLMPLLVHVFQKYRDKALAAVLSVSLLGILLCYGNVSNTLWGWSWGRFARGAFCFPLGFALCSLFFRRSRKDDSGAAAICLTATIVMALALYDVLPRILILCVLPVLVYFTVMNRGVICKLLSGSIARWLGDRSYSLYLWHTPIMYVYFLPREKEIDAWIHLPKLATGMINMAIIIVSVLVISELSWRFFESPLRRLFRTGIMRWLRPAG